MAVTGVAVLGWLEFGLRDGNNRVVTGAEGLGALSPGMGVSRVSPGTGASLDLGGCTH